MAIIAGEYIIVTVAFAWPGLYLLRSYDMWSAEWLAGVACSGYALFLLLRSLALGSPDTEEQVVLMRLSYLPAEVALVAFVWLAWLLGYPHEATPPGVFTLFILIGTALTALAVLTPVIVKSMTYSASLGYSRAVFGRLFWAWVIYAGMSCGAGIFLIGQAIYHHRRGSGIIRSTGIPLDGHLLSMTPVVMLTSVMNQIAMNYVNIPFPWFSIASTAGCLFLSYRFVSQFDRAFRTPLDQHGITLRVLADMGYVTVGTAATIAGAEIIRQRPLDLTLIFLICYLASLVAAQHAGTRHRFYYGYYMVYSRLNHQDKQPMALAVPAVVPPELFLALPGEKVWRREGEEERWREDVGEWEQRRRREGEKGTNLQMATPYDESGGGEDSEIEDKKPDEASTPLLSFTPSSTPDSDPQQELLNAVRLALRHLHNPARLGTISLLAAGLPGDTPWQRGVALQGKLIDAMQRLSCCGVNQQNTPWLCYQILWRLYHEGQTRFVIMRELSLSERHYQRQLREGLAMIVAQWQMYGNNAVDH